MEKDLVALTVLFVAIRNVPGIETPPPPPIVMPSRIATYVKENVVDGTMDALIFYIFIIQLQKRTYMGFQVCA